MYRRCSQEFFNALAKQFIKLPLNDLLRRRKEAVQFLADDRINLSYAIRGFNEGKPFLDELEDKIKDERLIVQLYEQVIRYKKRS